jgi:hypothetical protein
VQSKPHLQSRRSMHILLDSIHLHTISKSMIVLNFRAIRWEIAHLPFHEGDTWIAKVWSALELQTYNTSTLSTSKMQTWGINKKCTWRRGERVVQAWRTEDTWWRAAASPWKPSQTTHNNKSDQLEDVGRSVSCIPCN